jgi:hypothetical protein
MPSVTTSICVVELTLVSNLTRYPTLSPTLSPFSSLILIATDRAASLRGSSITIFLPASHDSSLSRKGTIVDLPAPGGACRITILFEARETLSEGIISSTG